MPDAVAEPADDTVIVTPLEVIPLEHQMVLAADLMYLSGFYRMVKERDPHLLTLMSDAGLVARAYFVGAGFDPVSEENSQAFTAGFLVALAQAEVTNQAAINEEAQA